MRKFKLKYIVIPLILIPFVLAVAYFCSEFYGLPWEHAAVKKEAVQYMKKKYNLDVVASGSSFNFKFDYYTAKVYNVNDGAKNIIRVEKQRFYDEQNQASGKRLEDNYSEIYWGKKKMDELQAKFPTFFKLDDIETVRIDTDFLTTPLEKGVSSDKDEQGAFIPISSDYSNMLDIKLNTNEFSDELLQELLLVIREIRNTQLKVDFIIRGTGKVSDSDTTAVKIKILGLKSENIMNINSVEDLKREIVEY
ncbi:hypothetical protein [Paenibacillus sp. FSL K6-2524]|uniref:hypothetical protein n=1 Tax=Paenibacillus sp. FSL K6-2524 TaxID=2954516 RepID=UPI0030F7E77F